MGYYIYIGYVNDKGFQTHTECHKSEFKIENEGIRRKDGFLIRYEKINQIVLDEEFVLWKKEGFK